eukprot:TRINITY_DN49122_c0_g1_i1.p1 TRINITY_DN49122_c0_g1~~TRINITY_DN49122_c0_g1_i1.p1  ORF type:complete len:1723 (-),score=237.71 TRINITY_DN49122_c0_g1_i1:93-5261(-)
MAAGDDPLHRHAAATDAVAGQLKARGPALCRWHVVPGGDGIPHGVHSAQLPFWQERHRFPGVPWSMEGGGGSSSSTASAHGIQENKETVVDPLKPWLASASSGRVRLSQAVVVFCSAARENHFSPAMLLPASSVFDAQDIGKRWHSWGDAAPTAQERLVEEQLMPTHREYVRLIHHHGGAQSNRAASGASSSVSAKGGAKAPPPCRACADPTTEHLKAVVSSVRRLTNERIVFHYVNHRAPGLPALRDDGHLLLYSQDSHEYRPLPIPFVHSLLMSPAVYVFDCPQAGRLIRALDEHVTSGDDIVALGACAEGQSLPWDRLGLPADLFTVCLTAPVRASLSFYRERGSAVAISDSILDVIQLVEGRHSDRESPFGEITAIFTAIADAVAFSCLPATTFWRLFREDGALAEICRNFLLASRLMRAYGLHVTSRPALPQTHDHHLWEVWDVTLELFLARLEKAARPSPLLGASVTFAATAGPRGLQGFFEEQMTAFSVWLRFQEPIETFGSSTAQNLRHGSDFPVELTMVLQALLHPSCRLHALHLFSCFVDFGEWAVYWTLLVGARPYLAKLLGHEECALHALPVWTKILSTGLGRELTPSKDTIACFHGLLKRQDISAFQRGCAAFCLAVACHGRLAWQQKLTEQGGLLEIIAKALLAQPQQETGVQCIRSGDGSWFRWTLLLLCAELCRGCQSAAVLAIKGKVLPDALLKVLEDPSPLVRASAVYAIGCMLKAAPPSSVQEEFDADSAPGSQKFSPRRTPLIMPRINHDSPQRLMLDAETPPPFKCWGPAVVTVQSCSRWYWLAHSMMWHFCKEPSPPGDRGTASVAKAGQSDYSQGLHSGSPSTGTGDLASLENPLLNEVSPLVRYELICALVPIAHDLATTTSNGGGGGSSNGGSAAWTSCASTLTPPPMDLDEVTAGLPSEPEESMSACSSCSSTPTLTWRSPSLRNSSIVSVPGKEVQQGDRKFMAALAQDSLTAALPPDTRRLLLQQTGHPSATGGAAARESRTTVRMTGSPPAAALLQKASERETGSFRGQQARQSAQDAAASPTRSVSSSNAAFSEVAGPVILPESQLFEWSTKQVQRPNMLSQLFDGSIDAMGKGMEADAASIDLSTFASTAVQQQHMMGCLLDDFLNAHPSGGFARYDSRYACNGQEPETSFAAAPSVHLAAPTAEAQRLDAELRRRVPSCPWGVPPTNAACPGGNGAASFEAYQGSCRMVTMPMDPLAPFVAGSSSHAARQAKEGAKAPREAAWAEGGSREPALPEEVDDVPVTAPILDVRMRDLLQTKESWSRHDVWEAPDAGCGSNALRFHASLPLCLVAGRHGQVAIIDYENKPSPTLLNSISVYELDGGREQGRTGGVGCYASTHEELACITQMTLINEHVNSHRDPHQTLLCCGTDDGLVRICRCWGCACHSAQPETAAAHTTSLACSFRALPRRQNAALCLHWRQQSSQLAVAGRDTRVRLWDLAQERLAHSFRHDSIHCVTCVSQCSVQDEAAMDSCASGAALEGLLFAGRGDGTLLAADCRTPTSVVWDSGLAVASMQREGVVSVVPAVKPEEGAANEYLVAAIDNIGDVDLWDMRHLRRTASYRLGGSGSATTLMDAAVSSGSGSGNSSGWATSSSGDGTMRLCCAPSASRNLVATVRPAEHPQQLLLSNLATGEQQCAFSLAQQFKISEWHPTVVGFHPTKKAFGILSQARDDCRLVLYSGINGAPTRSRG